MSSLPGAEFCAFLLLKKCKICGKIEKIHVFNAKQWTIL